MEPSQTNDPRLLAHKHQPDQNLMASRIMNAVTEAQISFPPSCRAHRISPPDPRFMQRFADYFFSTGVRGGAPGGGPQQGNGGSDSRAGKTIAKLKQPGLRWGNTRTGGETGIRIRTSSGQTQNPRPLGMETRKAISR